MSGLVEGDAFFELAITPLAALTSTTPMHNESNTQNAVGLRQKCLVHFEGTLKVRLGKLSALGC